MRGTRAALVATLAVALATPLAPAVAAPEPTGATQPTHAAAGRAAVVAARFAPVVPGAARFRWSIPAGVRQVVVVGARGWHSASGTVTLYDRTAQGWAPVASWPARLGYGGLVPAASRVQSTGTTPAGLFSITQAFGRMPDPGTRLPYTHLSSDHWWVEDRRSRYYNQLRLGHLGGFARRTHGYNASEHLAAMGPQYDYAAVVDFNRPHPVVGRGAGIFLHAFGDLTTVGCVSVRRDHMVEILRWLDPALSPRILVGPRSWLAG